MVRKQLPIAHLALALITLAGSTGMAFSQPATSGFTYQGELRTAGSLFQGVADVRFTLWTAESGGSQLGAALQAQGISVSQGRFSVILNTGNEFGPGAFNGQRRWIEISVRTPDNGGVYEVLSPRQEITGTPQATYATFATDAGTLGGMTPAQLRDAGGLTGTIPDAVLSNNIPLRTANQTFSGSNTFTGANVFSNSSNSYVGNGAGLTGLNASNIASGTVADGRLSANVALRGANQTFSGTNIFSGPTLLSNPTNSLFGNGAGLTNLNASNIVSGVLSDLQLSTNVAFRTASQTFLGSNTFTGANTFSGLTSFNDRIGVGTVPSNNFRMHLSGGAGQWKGGVAASGATHAVVMGELSGRATIGSNDAAFQTWQDLQINPFGGNVIIGGNVQAQPAGKFQVFSGPDVSSSPNSGYIRVGATNSQTLVMDTDEISSQTTNGAASTLRLNRLGGDVVVGGRVTAPSMQFADGSVISSAPIVQEIFDPTPRTVTAGGWIEFNLSAPGARAGMGIIVNPVDRLESSDALASARFSGIDFIQLRIQNNGSDPTVYVNRRWIVTLIPPSTP